MKRPLVLAGLAVMVWSGVRAHADGDPGNPGWPYFATNFNAVVFGDLATSGGSCENRLAVEGTAHFTGGYSVGIVSYGLPLPVYTNAQTDIMIAGGDLYDGAFSVNGNIVHGGTRYGPYRWMPNGNTVEQVVPVTLDPDGNVDRAGAGISWESLLTQACAMSEAMAALPDSGVVAKQLDDPWEALLCGTNVLLNVFNVDAPGWSRRSSTIHIEAPAGSTVLVNIHGASVAITNSLIQLSGVDRRHVVYNYADALSLSTKSFLHEGSLLAPCADASFLYGGVAGTAVLGGDVVASGFAFLNHPFAGADPANGGTDPETPTRTLSVVSEHGACQPAAGSHVFEQGETVVCAVTNSPQVSGWSHYACTGWRGTGSVPESGSAQQCSVALQMDSTIEWTWATNHWVSLGVEGEGSLSASSGWHPVGSALQIAATPIGEFGCFVRWTGDIGEASPTANPLAVAVDRPLEIQAVFGSTLPPDPADVAPPVRRGEVSILARNIDFLYTGENPIQTGVDTNAFDVKRMAVVRGRVLDREGQPLPGVAVSVQGHPEFGQTLSRLDGGYDMAVNGGGLVSLDFARDGYLRARRSSQTSWQDYAVFPDVSLVTADPVGTSVQFGTGVATSQVARASVVADDDGTRQATVIIPPGVQAYLVDAVGATQAVDALTLRFTEYTVGTNGPACMPAELPSSSFYTYCVELAADEAGDASVHFSGPVSFYVENFVGMPVGGNVPAAYYRFEGRPGWIPEQDGVVLQIVGIDGNGLAEVDVTGDGAAEDGSGLVAYELTEAERLELGRLYDVGDSLWRVQTAHFSPWDLNWPYYYVSDDDVVDPPVRVANPAHEINDSSKATTGGSINLENRSFNETLALAGTGLSLHYNSERTAAHKRSIVINNTAETIPESVNKVEIALEYLGWREVRTLSEDERTASEWRFGFEPEIWYRVPVCGAVNVRVTVKYFYDVVYGMTFSSEMGGRVFTFGELVGNPVPGIVLGRTQLSRSSVQTITVPGLSQVDGRQWGLGGWSIGAHHVYDPIAKVLYYGSGGESGDPAHVVMRRTITTAAGNGESGYSGDGSSAKAARLNQPAGVCVAADGTLYIADSGNNRIRKVAADGVISTVAGTGEAGYSGDGGLAGFARLNHPVGIAVSAVGDLYVSDCGNHVIRRISRDGIICTVAGNGTSGFSGDGDFAASAQLNTPMGIAVNAESTLFIADSGNRRIRRVAPNGRISTFAGSDATDSDDDIPARETSLSVPVDVALSEDGSLLIADREDVRIRRVGNDGIIRCAYAPYQRLFAKTTSAPTESKTPSSRVVALVIGQDSGYSSVATMPGSSTFFISDLDGRVSEVTPDGRSKSVAGGGWDSEIIGDGGPATASYLEGISSLAMGVDGTMYIADEAMSRIRKSCFAYPSFDANEILIESPDGTQLFVFDSAGRHLKTLDSTTRTTLYTFGYTAGRNQLLSTIRDANDLVVSIERNAKGDPLAIVGPHGHRTEIVLNEEGWLSELVNPADERNLMDYSEGGLLTHVANRRGDEFRQNYADDGRIVSNVDPVGGGNTVNTIYNDNGWDVEVVDGLSRTNLHCVERADDGTETRTSIDAAGLMTIKTTTPEGDVSVMSPDWSYTTLKQSPDPRFGMQAPMVTESQVQTWDHWNDQTFSRTVALADPDNPLSLTNQIDVATVNGREWRSEYCHPDRTIVATSPMGRWSRVKMDESGRPVLVESPGVHAVSNAYDALGRIVKTVQGEGAEAREVNFEYAPDGTLRSVENPLGETLLTFSDEIGRVADQILPDSSLVSFEYDRSSDPVKIILPHGEEHGFGHNPVGQTERYSAPPTGAVPTNTLWTYNVARQPVATIKPDGTVISNAYDSAGRLVSVTASRGGESDAVEYAYDEAWLDQVSRGGESIAYGYDCFLTTAEWTPEHDLNWEYDDDFRVVGVALDDTYATAYGYDDDGALVFAGDLALNRDAATGFLTNTVVGNVADSRSFNGFGEIADYAVTASASSLYSATYTRDALGRVASQTETVGAATTEKVYDYDVRGRLASVKTDGVVTEWYAYDRNGNRTNSMNGAAVYDAQDRLLANASTTFAYNLNGSLTNRLPTAYSLQSTAFSYDLFGQLKSVTLPDGRVVSYDRDALSRITAKRIDGVIVKGWIYKDALKPIAETDASGNVVSFFVYGTSALSPDTMDKDGVTYRFIRDVQGSVRLVVDAATGVVAQRLDYDTFGNVLTDTNPGFQPFGFQSGLYDPDTALVQFGARWYDAASGRWLSKDPILLEGGLNLYVFCGNDPVNFADPLGLCENGGQWSPNIWEEPGISDMSFEFIGFYLENLAATRAFGWVGGKLGRGASWIGSRFGSRAAKTGGQLPANLYHYTGAGNAESILQNGLGAGGRRTFATPVGNLSPVQAQIELALPANRGYPGALFEINTARLQQLGINPAVGPQRIMSTPNAGGGGIEFIFNQPIPPSAIRQVPFP